MNVAQRVWLVVLSITIVVCVVLFLAASRDELTLETPSAQDSSMDGHREREKATAIIPKDVGPDRSAKSDASIKSLEKLASSGDVRRRWSNAELLTRAGRIEEAYAEFAWCYKNAAALGNDSGVRTAIARAVAHLSLEHPNAFRILEGLRGIALDQLAIEPTNTTLPREIAAMDLLLGQPSQAIELFESLPNDDPRKRGVGLIVYDELLRNSRYDDAASVKPFETMVSELELLKRSMANNSGHSAEPRQRLVAIALSNIEVLVATGQTIEARVLVNRLYELDNSPEWLNKLEASLKNIEGNLPPR